MIKLIRPILLKFANSPQVKLMIIDLLRQLAKDTDNTIDDQSVDFIERGLFAEL